MTKPTKAVRAATFARDNWQCVAASYECWGPLEWQHRESSGHGGRGKKAGPLTCAAGLSLCRGHNQAAESHLQETALHLGWKLRRNRGGIPADQVPWFDRPTQSYYLPTGNTREPISEALAVELLALAGNLGQKGAA